MNEAAEQSTELEMPESPVKVEARVYVFNAARTRARLMAAEAGLKALAKVAKETAGDLDGRTGEATKREPTQAMLFDSEQEALAGDETFTAEKLTLALGVAEKIMLLRLGDFENARLILAEAAEMI